MLGKPKRGYKIVTLDSYSGTVDTVAVFDTWLHSDERTKVSNNLKAVSQHKIVIGAVYKDEHNSMPAAVNTTVVSFDFLFHFTYWRNSKGAPMFYFLNNKDGILSCCHYLKEYDIAANI